MDPKLIELIQILEGTKIIGIENTFCNPESESKFITIEFIPVKFNFKPESDEPKY